MSTQDQTQEKDYFWFYIAGLVIAVFAVLYVVKSGEHEKYATAQAAISQDASFSSYKDTSAYKK